MWIVKFLTTFKVYVYSAMFGPEKTARWMLSFSFCLFMSFVVLEPMKILFLSLFNSVRRIKRDPCELDNIVEYPRVEKSTSSMSSGHSKTCKVSPPHGFALEKAKQTAEKLYRWNRLKKNGLVFTIVFVTLIIALCDEHLNDSNQFNNQVQRLTKESLPRFFSILLDFKKKTILKIDKALFRDKRVFYDWLEGQCEHVDGDLLHVGPIYIFRKEADVSYQHCFDGFYPTDADFSSGCGEHDFIPMSSGDGCRAKVEQLAQADWFSRTTDQATAFLTFYAPHVNRLGSIEVSFRRLAPGTNSIATYHKLYSAYFHNWEVAFKFSAVVYVIIFSKFPR